MKVYSEQLCVLPPSHLVCLTSQVVMTCLLSSVVLQCSFLCCVFASDFLSFFVGFATLRFMSIKAPSAHKCLSLERCGTPLYPVVLSVLTVGTVWACNIKATLTQL